MIDFCAHHTAFRLEAGVIGRKRELFICGPILRHGIMKDRPMEAAEGVGMNLKKQAHESFERLFRECVYSITRVNV